MTVWILTGIIVFLIALTCWRDWHYSKVIDNLTSKLMARDWRDYATMNIASAQVAKPKQPKPKAEADVQKPVYDPVLGKHC